MGWTATDNSLPVIMSWGFAAYNVKKTSWWQEWRTCLSTEAEMLIRFSDHTPSHAQPLYAMYASASPLEPRIRCFSDRIWRLTPLHVPRQTGRLQGKPDRSISWLMLHESWSRGMMLEDGRCQARAVLALPDLPCLHSTSMALRGIPIAPGKAHAGEHQSITCPNAGMEEETSKKTQIQKQKQVREIRPSKTTGS